MAASQPIVLRTTRLLNPATATVLEEIEMHDSSNCPVCQGTATSGSMSDQQFFEFLETCRDELETKQAKFTSMLPVDAQWHYDLDTARLRIGNHEFPITAIGTHNDQHQTWLWAWANESFSAAARDASGATKSLYDVTGFKVFAEVGIDASSGDAQDLTACAIHALDAIGFYRCPSDATLYLAVHEPLG